MSRYSNCVRYLAFRLSTFTTVRKMLPYSFISIQDTHLIVILYAHPWSYQATRIEANSPCTIFISVTNVSPVPNNMRMCRSRQVSWPIASWCRICREARPPSLVYAPRGAGIQEGRDAQHRNKDASEGPQHRKKKTRGAHASPTNAGAAGHFPLVDEIGERIPRNDCKGDAICRLGYIIFYCD